MLGWGLPPLLPSWVYLLPNTCCRPSLPSGIPPKVRYMCISPSKATASLYTTSSTLRDDQWADWVLISKGVLIPGLIHGAATVDSVLGCGFLSRWVSVLSIIGSVAGNVLPKQHALVPYLPSPLTLYTTEAPLM